MSFSPKLLLSTFVLIWLISFGLAVGVGPYHVTMPLFFNNLFTDKQATIHEILWDIRIPTALATLVAGGLLALSGNLMQVMLRNPLADPYILGISGGAAVGSLLSLLLGLNSQWMILSSSLGAGFSLFIVFILARKQKTWSPIRTLLTGVMVASAWAAIINLILALSPNHLLHGMLFWLIGNINQPHLSLFSIAILIVGIVFGLFWSRSLNLLSQGEKTAQSLGVDTQRLQHKLYFLTAILTATAVNIVGTLGFIGLISPHLIRLLGIRDQRYLIPASVLVGGSLLTLADTVARTIISPQQLPVGIITALLGVPLFLYLLRRV